jgi:hypothetical membrane protein
LKTKFSFTRLAAMLGMLGPGLFGCVLAGLTYTEYDFMSSLGWDAFKAPTLDWPSGLALGPFGWIMTATFLVSGVSLLVFAFGLRRKLSGGRAGSLLLALAGLALMGLAFHTDPTLRASAATWHGRLHDLSFVILGITLMPGMLVLGASFRNDPRWKDLAVYTFATASLALPTFFIKGAAFYVFLVAILIWCELTAVRLWRLTNQ